MQYIEYDIEDRELVFNLDTGGELSVFVEDEFMVMNDTEYDFDHDGMMKDVIVMHGGKYYTLGDVMRWCLSNIETIHAVERTQRNIDYAMTQELASVEYTGRV